MAAIQKKEIVGEADLGGSPDPTPSTSDPQLPSSYKFSLLLSLPDVVVRRLLSYLSYDQVARMRAVCKSMDAKCGSHLNLGFLNAEKYHTQLKKKIESRLPRSDSERLNHPLFRHWVVLLGIGTRISILQMTFRKYIDAKACCFIPGKVIDELFEVLRKISATDAEIPLSYEVNQEFRDISSMAREYFEEKIVPTLKVPTPTSSNKTPLLSGGLTPVGVNEEWKFDLAAAETRGEVAGLKKTLSEQSSALANLESRVSAQQSLIASQNKKLKAQDKKIKAQDKKIEAQDKKIDALVAKWNDGPDAASRKRKFNVDGDEEGESRPRRSKRLKKAAA